MKRSTLALLVVVLAALTVILLWERKHPGTDEAKAQEGKLLPGLPEAKEFTRLERTGEAPLILEKAGEAWVLRSPLQDAADGYGVEGFLDQIRQAKAVRFLDAPVPWKELGLETPRVTWTLKAGGKTFSLAMGSNAGMNEGCYLKAGGRAALGPGDLEATLLRKPEEFRSRDLVPQGAGRVASFRIQRPGVPALSASRSGDSWVLKEPFVDDGDASKIESVLDAVTYLQASAFEEPSGGKDFGLASPRAAVTLTTDKGKTFEVKLGADAPPEAPSPENPAREERIYASVSGRPSILVVGAKILKGIEDASPDSLRSVELFRHPQYEAEELVVEGAATALMKRDAQGRWTFSPPAKAPSGTDAAPVAETLLALRGVSAAALGPGVPAPEAFATLVMKGKGFEERVLVGPEKDGKRYAYPKSRSAAILLGAEAWRRAEDAIKAIPLAPAKK